MGLIPGTSNTIIVEGPFKFFNKKTNILYHIDGSGYLLEPTKIEKTKQPPLFDRTIKTLKNLSNI
jgi:hypothetical protein